MKQTRSTTKQDFSGEALSKTKHRGLTSLAFMELVPGADRVVRHICIRCMDGKRQLEQLKQCNGTTKQLLFLASFHRLVNYDVLIIKQATSALAGLLEEDAIATDESKIIDNAWRGAEVN